VVLDHPLPQRLHGIDVACRTRPNIDLHRANVAARAIAERANRDLNLPGTERGSA
jgi:hypothetical protein